MGGKSKSATVGYWYEVAFHSGLGIGPIDAYLEFRGGDKTAWRGEATQSQTIHINAQNLWGGEKDQGGIVGAVDLMFGEATQQPSSRLAGIFGPQQPAWRGFATLAFAGKYGAMNPYPQKASHKIRKIREGWDGECWYPGKAAIPMPSCSGGDPYIYATTPPYPVVFPPELGDQATTTPSIIGGSLRDVYRIAPPLADAVSTLPSMVGGAISVPPVPLTVDQVTTTPSIIAGRIAAPPAASISDSSSTTPSMQGGGLKTIPIGSTTDTVATTPSIQSGRIF